jgi:hypothetical protein
MRCNGVFDFYLTSVLQLMVLIHYNELLKSQKTLQMACEVESKNSRNDLYKQCITSKQ